MTRTARASYPRAVIRDRSLSKSGLDGHIQKGGAGRHNWGDLEHEPRSEFDQYDEEEEEMEEEIPNGDAPKPCTCLMPLDSLIKQANAAPADNEEKNKKPDLSRSTSSMSAEELEAARTIRKNALKKGALFAFSPFIHTFNLAEQILILQPLRAHPQSSRLLHPLMPLLTSQPP